LDKQPTKEAENYAPWGFQRFIILCRIWDEMGHIRKKPMVLVWPVDEKKKRTNVLMGIYVLCR
jgi:hypothetical protein